MKHTVLQEDLVGIVDCPEPDKLTMSERRSKRLEAENEKFDEDHYLYVYSKTYTSCCLYGVSEWTSELMDVWMDRWMNG